VCEFLQFGVGKFEQRIARHFVAIVDAAQQLRDLTHCIPEIES
jgi:hypothetical protein